MSAAIKAAYGRDVIQRVQCGAKRLASPIVDEIRDNLNEDDVVHSATVNGLGHLDGVEESEQGAPAGLLDCSTVASMDVAG